MNIKKLLDEINTGLQMMSSLDVIDVCHLWCIFRRSSDYYPRIISGKSFFIARKYGTV
jgi:hypothetical protein